MRHALGVILLFVLGSAQAATVVYSSPGVVTGIGGLDIGGTLYNVDFDTDFDAYATFGGVEDFWALQVEALVAAEAINDVLNTHVLADFVDNTFGNVYQVNYGGDLLAQQNIAALGSWVLGSSVSPQAGEITTAWSVVPIPAAVWLFGSALAGLGWLRRRQTA